MTDTAAATTAALTCPTCGAAVLAGDKFCESCGAALPTTAAPAVPTAAATAPEVDYAADVPPVGPPCVSCGADASQIVDGYCGVCGMKQPAPRDHIEVSRDNVAAVTDRGRKHHRNEDAFALRAEPGQPVIAIVCDGVSTTIDPDKASQVAADAALATLIAGGNLTAAHAAAQQAVLAVSDKPPPPDLGWPSCTFLGAVVTGRSVELGTLGDCRTFWLPAEGQGDPQALTTDDSWAAEQIASGAMTPEEAYANPLAHTITRWLGRDADPTWTPRLSHFDAPSAGRLVLCSDGLWNYAEEPPAIKEAAGGAADDPLAVAKRLVDFANSQGGHDNITVIVIDLKESE